ncbi:MAG TPA: hypothetical protein VKB19_04015 [Pedobacter sp.]|nr:hypothetical protein [Pedobacter sp.]
MKKLIVIIFIATAMGCSEQPGKVDYKSKRDEVMSLHDVVMADHGIIVENQMKLDTLLKDLKGLKIKYPEVDTAKEKANISSLLADLTKAEDQMNNWMHKFEPDVSDKSKEAAVQYFEAEKLKISQIDSLYKKEIISSNAYLHQFRKP